MELGGLSFFPEDQVSQKPDIRKDETELSGRKSTLYVGIITT